MQRCHIAGKPTLYEVTNRLWRLCQFSCSDGAQVRAPKFPPRFKPQSSACCNEPSVLFGAAQQSWPLNICTGKYGCPALQIKLPSPQMLRI